MRNHDIWKKLKMRDDDIVIASTIKSGTTWLQQIVAQLVFKGNFEHNLNDVSLWADSLFDYTENETIDILEKQTHRRFMKTHSPSNLVFTNNNKNAKYIFITRDFRDVVWSFYNHFTKAKYKINKNKNRALDSKLRSSKSQYEFWKLIIENKHLFHTTGKYRIIWSYFNTIKSWLNEKDNENVLILHFNDLKKDLKAHINKISKFLGYEYLEKDIDHIHNKCTFEWMKSNSHRCAPKHFTGKSEAFINRGSNKRWHGTLEEKDIKDYKNIIDNFFDKVTVDWIENGNKKPVIHLSPAK